MSCHSSSLLTFGHAHILAVVVFHERTTRYGTSGDALSRYVCCAPRGFLIIVDTRVGLPAADSRLRTRSFDWEKKMDAARIALRSLFS